MKKRISILLVVFLILAAAAIGYFTGKSHGGDRLAQTDDPYVEQTDESAAEQTDEPTMEQTDDPYEEEDPVIQYLERISRRGERIIYWDEPSGLDAYLYHYQVQSDGHGLAMMLPLDGEGMGSFQLNLYETNNAGKSWEMLPEDIYVAKGSSAVVYMGEVVVIAVDQPKADYGYMMISYDRGHTWDEGVVFSELIAYDTESGHLIPHIINYNEDSGMITFGWTMDYSEQFDSDTYILINQFDVYTCQIVKEYYRHPEFSEWYDSEYGVG